MRGLLLIAGVALGAPAHAQSAATVRATMIRDSIAAYPGACPCPYSVMRNGRLCGGRSAHSRPGGYRPYCYPDDIPVAALARRR